MGLRSYIETGIALDAVLTYDLLISIFNPGTPLHDGAVVIQGEPGRRRRLLPAAHREPGAVPDPGQPAPRGHRRHRGHRRAGRGGLRGDRLISLVAGGEIRRELDGAHAEAGAARGPRGRGAGERARTAARRPTAARGASEKQMRFLFENLGLKALSLGLAAVLWFVIAGETTSEIGLAGPARAAELPRDLELTGDAVNAVEVRLRASPGHHARARSRRRLGADRPARRRARASASST